MKNGQNRVFPPSADWLPGERQFSHILSAVRTPSVNRIEQLSSKYENGVGENERKKGRKEEKIEPMVLQSSKELKIV